MGYTDQPFDEKYWGAGGVDVSRWGYECGRGIRYKDMGPVTDGQKGAIRKISTGRKRRKGTDDKTGKLPSPLL